jgi:hypothetical protein
MSLHRSVNHKQPALHSAVGVPKFVHTVDHELVGRVVAMKREAMLNQGYRIEGVSR